MSGAFLLGAALLNSQTRGWDWYDENGVCLLANDRTHQIRCILDAQIESCWHAILPVYAVMRKPTEGGAGYHVRSVRALMGVAEVKKIQ